MIREDFIAFFRDDEKLETLTTDDRIEVFLGILSSGSDITKNLVDRLLSDYGVDTLEVVEKDPIDETVCPECGATLEWGDSEIEGDTEVKSSVWCPNSECNWEGDNYYNLVFREQAGS